MTVQGDTDDPQIPAYEQVLKDVTASITVAPAATVPANRTP
jgi:hypothetical protein